MNCFYFHVSNNMSKSRAFQILKCILLFKDYYLWLMIYLMELPRGKDGYCPSCHRIHSQDLARKWQNNQQQRQKGIDFPCLFLSYHRIQS